VQIEAFRKTFERIPGGSKQHAKDIFQTTESTISVERKCKVIDKWLQKIFYELKIFKLEQK
jgi:hypothetical protein